MAGYKLSKRKGVDEVSDDFSDFSLSSPATKIRRLDAEVEVEPLPVTEAAAAPNPNENEERALVLFKPPSSSFSLSLHSDILSGIKNWSKQCDSDSDRLIRSQQQENYNDRLALVPWVPSSYSQFPHLHDSNSTEADEMEAEADETMMMDIEQQHSNNTDSLTSNIHPTVPLTTATPPDGFHQQQQQQHCLLPRFPQKTSTPITWTH